MTVTDEPTAMPTASPDWVDELRSFLHDNWDPSLTVGEWWDLLGMAGWSAPLLPGDAYGRGMNRADAMLAGRIIADFGALGAPMGMGIGLVAPTINTHGTREQIDRYLPDIVTGRKWWCQLFSEPGAGSDLAGLGTRAVRDGDVWVVNGQKVWTSGGHWADLGMLLARTDPSAPKHQGITWFALDMHQPGVEVRTLREMTGGSLFCEVFFTDAIVGDIERIGDVNSGWTVANTTLFHERSGMGAGGERGQRWSMARRGNGVRRSPQASRRLRQATRQKCFGTEDRDKDDFPRQPLHRPCSRGRQVPGSSDPSSHRTVPHPRRGPATQYSTPPGGASRRWRHPRTSQLFQAAHGAHPPAQPRSWSANARSRWDAPRLRRGPEGHPGRLARCRGGRCCHGPSVAGTSFTDLRRHGPNPTQHHW